jgi:hypothetical protein
MEKAAFSILSGIFICLAGWLAVPVMAADFVPQIQPVFEGVDYIQVDKLQADRTLTVYIRNPATGAEKPAAPARQTRGWSEKLRLDAPLAAGQIVRAEVLDSVTASKRISYEVEVQPLLPPVTPPHSKIGPQLTENAECIKLAGVTPLAVARVTDAGGTVIGEAVADSRGEAELFLNRGLAKQEKLVFSQILDSAEAASKNDVASIVERQANPVEGVWAEQYRKLEFGPVQSCQPNITLSGHEPGASYAIWLRDGDTTRTVFGRKCAPENATNNFLSTPVELLWGQLHADQSFNLPPGQSGPVPSLSQAQIQAVQSLTPIEILPVKAGAKEITVRNLRAGARIELARSLPGQPTLTETGTLAGAGNAGFVLSPQARHGETITVKQAFCDKENQATRQVDPAPATIARIKPVPTIFACAGSVEIAGVTDSAWVRLFARDKQTPDTHSQISLMRQHTAGSGPQARTAPFYVQPTTVLRDGQEVAATQTLGGLESGKDRDTDWVQVEPFVEFASQDKLVLSDPTLEGATVNNRAVMNYCAPSILAKGKRGATVRITGGGLFAGSGLAYDEFAAIPLTGAQLTPGMSVYGQQSMCSVNGNPSETLTAVGKVRITGTSATGGVEIPRGKDGQSFWLTVETECQAIENLTFQISSSATDVVDLAGPGTVTIKAGENSARVLMRAKQLGSAELTVANAADHSYVQVGAEGWERRSGAFTTVVKVSEWQSRSKTVSMSAKPGGVQGSLRLDPPQRLPIHITRLGHKYLTLDLRFTDDLGDGTDICPGGVWAEVLGLSAAGANGETAAEAGAFTDNEGFYTVAVQPNKEVRDTVGLVLKACFFGSGTSQPMPWTVKVTYDKLVSPDDP